MPYPWNEDDVLVAADLNAAIAGVTANAGRIGPQGPPGALIQSGYGPPTEDAPDGTTYFDLSNGDVWTFGEPGGGGGTPDWVPAGAVIHIDLVGGTPQGRAWTATSGEVAVDTLLGSDPNTENGWGITAYDAVFLTVDGYNNPDHPVAFIGEARARITGAATLTYKLKQIGGGAPSSPDFVVVSADGNDALEIDLLREVVSDVFVAAMSSWNGEPEVTSPDVINLGDGSFNMVAVTISAFRFESSYNGCAPVVYPVTEAGRPSGNPLVAALLDIVASGAAGATFSLQSFTIYDPLPTTAGLSELSEVM